MNPLFQDSFEALLQNEVDPVAAGIGLRDLSEKAEGRALELLEQLLVSRSELANTDPAIVGTVLRILHASLLREGWSLVQSLPIETIVQLEQAIPPRSSNRFLLQQLYAIHQSDQALIALVESLSLQPPQKWVEAAQVLSPLMH